ncbi:hypothetical protein HK099_003502 [Clydaea vesicula]|uniref:Uncharacterized protein n=1 Tax=Clydaea vesicula TaxID=447962 RepID=A0AAD5Y093_9FUNG|nr:hypothetical protein HK099_003502 [Clydaea vesicula]
MSASVNDLDALFTPDSTLTVSQSLNIPNIILRDLQIQVVNLKENLELATKTLNFLTNLISKDFPVFSESASKEGDYRTLNLIYKFLVSVNTEEQKQILSPVQITTNYKNLFNVYIKSLEFLILAKVLNIEKKFVTLGKFFSGHLTRFIKMNRILLLENLPMQENIDLIYSLMRVFSVGFKSTWEEADFLIHHLMNLIFAFLSTKNSKTSIHSSEEAYFKGLLLRRLETDITDEKAIVEFKNSKLFLLTTIITTDPDIKEQALFIEFGFSELFLHCLEKKYDFKSLLNDQNYFSRCVSGVLFFTSFLPQALWEKMELQLFKIFLELQESTSCNFLIECLSEISKYAPKTYLTNLLENILPNLLEENLKNYLTLKKISILYLKLLKNVEFSNDAEINRGKEIAPSKPKFIQKNEFFNFIVENHLEVEFKLKIWLNFFVCFNPNEIFLETITIWKNLTLLLSENQNNEESMLEAFSTLYLPLKVLALCFNFKTNGGTTELDDLEEILCMILILIQNSREVIEKAFHKCDIILMEKIKNTVEELLRFSGTFEKYLDISHSESITNYLLEWMESSIPLKNFPIIAS